MSTTTIRLPDDLKSRVAAAAERAGTTTHAFILQAIADKTNEEERRLAFGDLADQRYEQILATGKAIAWGEMRAYLEKRSTGAKARAPVARKLGR